MKYSLNRARARTINTQPTLTDQSAARETDINVIVATYQIHGQLPTGKPPINGDFTGLPTDLRGFIEMGRNMNRLKDSLPDPLKAFSIEQLTQLTAQQIRDALTPPDKPADTQKKDDTK